MQAIVDTIRYCPSGALNYLVDGVEQNPEKIAAAVTMSKNSPHEIMSGVQLINPSWCEGVSSARYTLCRCGGSKNKAFYDGAHWSIGFKNE